MACGGHMSQLLFPPPSSFFLLSSFAFFLSSSPHLSHSSLVTCDDDQKTMGLLRKKVLVFSGCTYGFVVLLVAFVTQ